MNATTNGAGIGTRATVVLVVQDGAIGRERVVSVRATKQANGWTQDGTGEPVAAWLIEGIEQERESQSGA
jgi:hypothetical protein